MKTDLPAFFRFLLMALLVVACTKQVSLVTEVEFELVKEYRQNGYVQQSLPTTLTVIPEAELEGYTYSYTYQVSSGNGYFLDGDGEQLPAGEKIPFNPLSSSVFYTGTAKGNHVVKITAEDSFGFTEETELAYEIADIPLVWTASAAATQVEPGTTVAITLTLQKGTDAVDLALESKFSLASGSGTLAGPATGDTIIAEEYSAIEPGTYTLNYVPDALGTAALIFDVRDSNGQELRTSVTIDVVEELVDTIAPEIMLLEANPQQVLLNDAYTESGATANDAIDGTLTDQIIIDATAVDTTQEGSYEVIYTVSDEAGNTATAVRTVVVNSAIADLPVTGIDVLPKTATIAIGATRQLTATITPGFPAEQGVTWSSSNMTVATVDDNGLVTAITDGDATITAASVENGSITDTAIITGSLTQVQVTAITVNSSRTSIPDDETEQFTADISPVDVTNPDVVWSSSNQGVATVNASTGFVTAVSAGTTNIIATATDGSGVSGSKVLTVTTSQIPVTTITVTRDRSSIPDNETEQFTAVVAPTNATNATVNWSSTNLSVATVNASSGLVTAVSAGTTNIVATATDGSGITGAAGLTVTASPILVTGITVSSGRASIPDGQTENFMAAVTPGNASNSTVTWSSSNAAVATVNASSGLVTAISAGTTDIIATANDGSGVSGFKELEVTASPILVTGITVSSGRASIPDDQIENFMAAVTPGNASNSTVTWSSSNTAVATVNASSGLVIAVSAGTTDIIATANDGSGVSNFKELEVTASSILVTGITVSSGRASIPDDQTENFMAAVTPGNASNSTVTWSSSNAAVATVNASSGLVTAVSAGTTDIIATANDGSGVSGFKELEVTASPILVTGITVSSGRASIPDDQIENFMAAVAPGNASNSTVTWSSSNTAVATVNASSGLVIAVSAGTTDIIATANDGSGVSNFKELEVTASSILVTGITVSSGRASIPDDQTENFMAAVTPGNASNSTVTWSSSNVAVATVNASSGLVMAVSAGTTDIIATATDGSGISDSKTLTVTTNHRPTALISSDVTGGTAPVTVSFTGDGSSDSDVGDTLSYSWDFGDGSSISTETNPSHTFTNPGRYTVTLTVTDLGNLSDAATLNIGVFAPSNPDFSFGVNPVSPQPIDGYVNGQNIALNFRINPNSDMPPGTTYTMEMFTTKAILTINSNSYRERNDIPMNQGSITGVFRDVSGSPDKVTVTFTVTESIIGITKSRTMTFDYCTGNFCVQP